jgi:hypothetical protein
LQCLKQLRHRVPPLKIGLSKTNLILFNRNGTQIKLLLMLLSTHRVPFLCTVAR